MFDDLITIKDLIEIKKRAYQRGVNMGIIIALGLLLLGIGLGELTQYIISL